MKIALITTTINVPKVLELYRKFAPENCRFFIALDKKSPDMQDWSIDLMSRRAIDPEAIFLSPDAQEQYESSALTGWNTDSRRNFALLEALKWGADIIVSVDDDMLVCNGEWVRPELFEENYDGLQLGSPKRWFDNGFGTYPPTPQRGLPPQANPGTDTVPDFVMGARIGAAQGIILGVPDTSGVSALANTTIVVGVTDILRNGFVVHPQAYAVYNSQLTAFRRELAPAFAQFYAHQGRNTDIFASVLMRRIMQERNLYTYYGMPMGFHARQPRPLFKDLEAEMYGLKHIQAFADYLADSPINGKNVIDDCDHLMLNCPIFSDDLKEVASAWYRDCSKVM